MGKVVSKEMSKFYSEPQSQVSMISLKELDAVKEEPREENIPKIIITNELRN